MRWAVCRTAVERESRCLPLPRVALGRLGLSQIGRDPNHPCRRGRFLLCPEGDELEACST
jgi:hypothetical protein